MNREETIFGGVIRKYGAAILMISVCLTLYAGDSRLAISSAMVDTYGNQIRITPLLATSMTSFPIEVGYHVAAFDPGGLMIWETSLLGSGVFEITEVEIAESQVLIAGSFLGEIDLGGLRLSTHSPRAAFTAVFSPDGRCLRATRLEGEGETYGFGLIHVRSQWFLVGQHQEHPFLMPLSLHMRDPFSHQDSETGAHGPILDFQILYAGEDEMFEGKLELDGHIQAIGESGGSSSNPNGDTGSGGSSNGG